jgi:glycosyltransferase involved in cell wall biosynthesis
MREAKANQRKLLVSLFRYSLHDHEAMANTYPRVLAKLGLTLDVHHFCGSNPKQHWLANEPGVVVHELPIRFHRRSETDKWTKTILWYFVSMRAAWWARRHRADLLYIEESLPWLPVWLSLISGRPVAISAADIFWDVYLPDGGIAAFIKRLLLRVDTRFLKQLRGLITHTRAFKSYAVRLGVSESRVFVVPEACEEHIFTRLDRSSARHNAGYKDHELIILHHGILAPNKALDRLLDYIAPILIKRPHVRIEFAGDGPVRGQLERKAQELGIKNQVKMLGWLPDVSRLNTLLNAADISIIMREGRFSDHFQVTANLLHSLACGSTILAARLQGIAELVEDNRNGLLFNPGDGEECGRQLTRLLDDAPLRKKLADAALITAQQQLDPRTITTVWADALESLMTDTGAEVL